jgi:putative protease
MPIEEDEHGTYILNSKDLRAIEHVQRLTEIEVKNKFSIGDRIEVNHPSGKRDVTIAALRHDGSAIDCAPGNGHRVALALPPGLDGAFIA